MLGTLQSLRGDIPKPIIIWEPVPDLCTPDNLLECFKTLNLVDIVSPNAAEIGAFYGISELEASKRENIERHAKSWTDNGAHKPHSCIVIVRAGKDGCCISSKDHGIIWLPAYYGIHNGKNTVHKVVDPTGGGNAFVRI